MGDFSGYFNQFHQNIYGTPAFENQSLQVSPYQAQPMQGSGSGEQKGPAQQISDAYGYYDKAKKMQQLMQGPSTGAPPAGATEPYGQGMGMFPNSGATAASTEAGTAGAEAAGSTEATGAATMNPYVLPVIAAAYGMKRYNDLGYGHGYQDFVTGDWSRQLLMDKGATNGLENMSKPVKQLTSGLFDPFKDLF